MKTVLVAGATGYLGRRVVAELASRGYRVRALGRSGEKLAPIKDYADELFVGDVTKPDTLAGLCDGVDIVFSSLGITRQKDDLTYEDVDYQGNVNLLRLAEASGVRRFVYIHVANAEKLSHLAMIKAKQAFVDELKRSPVAHTVICPTGFFSDMEEFLSMARSGRAWLFGDGLNQVNPIHGADLAEFIVDAFDGDEEQLDVGGPDVFTYREIAEMAFDAVGRRPKISCIPKSLLSVVVGGLRRLTSAQVYGPIEFMADVMTMNVIGRSYGYHHLPDHLCNCNSMIEAGSDEDHPLPV